MYVCMYVCIYIYMRLILDVLEGLPPTAALSRLLLCCRCRCVRCQYLYFCTSEASTLVPVAAPPEEGASFSPEIAVCCGGGREGLLVFSASTLVLVKQVR
jgi:hypothetical protein